MESGVISEYIDDFMHKELTDDIGVQRDMREVSSELEIGESEEVIKVEEVNYVEATPCFIDEIPARMESQEGMLVNVFVNTE